MGLLQYSNGWGHLIMSVVLCAAGLAMILVPYTDPSIKAAGCGILTSVGGYWMVTSSANAIIRAMPGAPGVPTASAPPVPPEVPPPGQGSV